MTAVLALVIADANAARGGGGRGGGRMAHSSVSGAGRSLSRPSNVGGSRTTGNINRGSIDRGSIDRGNIDRGNIDRGNIDRGNIDRGNIDRGNIDRGNISRGDVNIGNDVNVNIDGGYRYRGDRYYDHPIAAGVAIGTVAVTTAAVLGSYYRTLPPGCTVVVRAGVSYYYCGSVYYQQTWSGDDVVYVVVNP